MRQYFYNILELYIKNLLKLNCQKTDFKEFKKLVLHKQQKLLYQKNLFIIKAFLFEKINFFAIFFFRHQKNVSKKDVL